MQFFRRIFTDKHKFKMQMFINKVQLSRILPGKIYLSVRRGNHKRNTTQLLDISPQKECDFHNEILTFEAITLFYDPDDKKYHEKPGQIKVLLKNSNGDKKLLGIVPFDVGQVANASPQSKEYKRQLCDTVPGFAGNVSFEMFLKYIGQGSESGISQPQQRIKGVTYKSKEPGQVQTPSRNINSPSNGSENKVFVSQGKKRQGETNKTEEQQLFDFVPLTVKQSKMKGTDSQTKYNSNQANHKQMPIMSSDNLFGKEISKKQQPLSKQAQNNNKTKITNIFGKTVDSKEDVRNQSTDVDDTLRNQSADVDDTVWAQIRPVQQPKVLKQQQKRQLQAQTQNNFFKKKEKEECMQADPSLLLIQNIIQLTPLPINNKQIQQQKQQNNTLNTVVNVNSRQSGRQSRVSRVSMAQDYYDEQIDDMFASTLKRNNNTSKHSQPTTVKPPKTVKNTNTHPNNDIEEQSKRPDLQQNRKIQKKNMIFELISQQLVKQKTNNQATKKQSTESAQKAQLLAKQRQIQALRNRIKQLQDANNNRQQLEQQIVYLQQKITQFKQQKTVLSNQLQGVKLANLHLSKQINQYLQTQQNGQDFKRRQTKMQSSVLQKQKNELLVQLQRTKQKHKKQIKAIKQQQQRQKLQLQQQYGKYRTDLQVVKQQNNTQKHKLDSMGKKTQELQDIRQALDAQNKVLKQTIQSLQDNLTGLKLRIGQQMNQLSAMGRHSVVQKLTHLNNQ